MKISVIGGGRWARTIATVLGSMPDRSHDITLHSPGKTDGEQKFNISLAGPGVKATNAWLVMEGFCSANTMQGLDPYLTARGDVYRAQSVGYFDDGGPVVRLEAVIDAAVQPARILNIRDLSELGRGFTRQQLGVP